MREPIQYYLRYFPLLVSSAVIVVVLTVACSGGGADPTAAPVPSPIPTSSPDPTATPVPNDTPAPTVDPTAIPPVAPTSTPEPTATPTPVPSPTAVVSNTFDEFGFTIQLDQDASFESSDFNVMGWTETDASTDQGLMTFTYTGAEVVFFWAPQGDDTPQATVDSTYELQKLSRQNSEFTPISEGDLTVDGQAGRFGGFVATGSAGEEPSGGLIGAWACGTTATINSLTVTGPDATALQIRFDRIVSEFECGS